MPKRIVGSRDGSLEGEGGGLGIERGENVVGDVEARGWERRRE